jgi:hypothetical protein
MRIKPYQDRSGTSSPAVASMPHLPPVEHAHRRFEPGAIGSPARPAICRNGAGISFTSGAFLAVPQLAKLRASG